MEFLTTANTQTTPDTIYPAIIEECKAQCLAEGHILTVQSTAFEHGSKGKVFHATISNHQGVAAALKIMYAQNDSEHRYQTAASSSLTRANAAARVPTVIKPFTLPKHPQYHAILMSYVPGVTLDNALRRVYLQDSPLHNPYNRYRAVYTIGKAIAALLGGALVPADLSDTNIMLWVDPTQVIHVYLIDWERCHYFANLVRPDGSVSSSFKNPSTQAGQAYQEIVQAFKGIMRRILAHDLPDLTKLNELTTISACLALLHTDVHTHVNSTHAAEFVQRHGLAQTPVPTPSSSSKPAGKRSFWTGKRK